MRFTKLRWPGLLALCVLVARPAAAAEIVLIGDSWGVLGGPSIIGAIQGTGHAVAMDNLSIGGSTAANWNAGVHDDIGALLAANTDEQAVHVILGGNDLFAAATSPDPFGVLNQAVNDVLTTVAGATTVPILYSGYDYGPTADAASNAFLDIYMAQVAFAVSASPIASQVTMLNSNGLMQVVFGGLAAPDPNQPGPCSAYADPIHLNVAGYDVYADNLYAEFYAAVLPEPSFGALCIAGIVTALRSRRRVA